MRRLEEADGSCASDGGRVWWYVLMDDIVG